MIINTGINLGENPINTFFIVKHDCYLSLKAETQKEVVKFANAFASDWSTILSLNKFIRIHGTNFREEL